MRPTLDEQLERWLVGGDASESLLSAFGAEGLEALRALEASVAALVLALEPVSPPPGLRERVLDSLDPSDRFGPLTDAVAELLGLDGPAVRAVFERLDREEAWLPGPAEGVRVQLVDSGPGIGLGKAWAVRAEPGVAFPDHIHHGDERLIIMQGGCRETDGTVSKRGDFVERGDGTHHGFEALAGPPLILLAVTDDHVEFLPSH